MKLDADYWVTREGNKVYPKDMTDEHLINTIRYLHENVDGIALCYRPFPSFLVLVVMTQYIMQANHSKEK